MDLPASCARIQDEITALEKVRAATQQELSTAAPQEKPGIVKVIRRLTAQISDLHDDLVDCIAMATPIPAAPALGIHRIEVVQAIQTPTDGVGLVAGKRTAVRVYLTSGLPGGPGFPPDAGFVAQVTGALDVTDVPAGTSTTLQPLNPGGVVTAPPAVLIDPDQADRSLLFELPPGFLQGTVRVTATAHVSGQPSIAAPPASKTFTLLPQPPQEVLPVLFSDPLLLLQPPSRAAFAATLAGARAKMPVADQGFVVKTPIETSMSAGIDLRGTLGWTWLAFNMATWVFLFPTQDVGGLRTGLVPNDSRYALNGIGTPRAALAVPATITRAGLGTTLAHESGHAFGLGHAPCPAAGTPGAPPDVDPQLPGRLRTSGLDVPARTVVPSGSGEVMSYCGGPSRWPSEDYWEHVRTRVPI